MSIRAVPWCSRTGDQGCRALSPTSHDFPMKLPIPEHIRSIVPYPPGKPLDELERQYGVKNAIKLASNENPWGPSPRAIAAITAALPTLHRYPDGSSYALTQALARHLHCAPEMLVLGNGSDEMLGLLVSACMEPGDEAISSFPSFLMYQKCVQVQGCRNIVLPLKDMRHDLEAIARAATSRTRLVFLDNPNNPTGSLFPEAALLELCRALPDTALVVLDEAYRDFADPALQLDSVRLAGEQRQGAQIVALRTFSKAYGLAGLRLGYGLMRPELAAMLHRVRHPFNVNSLAQVGVVAALADQEHYARTISGTRAGLACLQEAVNGLGCSCFPSQSNFFLVDVQGDANRLYEAMLHRGVITRSMSAYGFPNYLRITVGTEAENRRFLTALAECLHELHYV